MSRSLVALAVLVICRTALAGGDVTQTIDSPISPGSGLTLNAAQNATSLTVGIEQQFGTAWAWNAAIQAAVDGADTTTLFSRANGLQPGTTLRLGVSWSGARAKPQAELAARCTQLLDAYKAWRAHQRAKAAYARCTSNLARLRKGLGLPAAESPALVGDDAAAACDSQVVAFSGQITDDTPESKRVKQALDALHESTLKVDTSVIASVLGGEDVGSSGGERTLPTCGDVTNELRGADASSLAVEDRGRYYELLGLASLFEMSSAGGPYVRVGFSSYATYAGGQFHPEDDLATSTSWQQFVPSGSVDVALIGATWLLGVSVGGGGVLVADQENVCKHNVDGDYYYDQCSMDYVGRPERRWAGHISALASLNPLLQWSNFDAGIQFMAKFTTSAGAGADGSQHDIFEHGSWHYVLSLPLFLTAHANPYGLSFGIAPQMAKTIDVDQDEDFRLLFFVGARPSSAGGL